VFNSAYHCFGISITTSHDKDYNQRHILPRFTSATSSGDKGEGKGKVTPKQAYVALRGPGG
jgi:hypothetical protein